MIFESEVAPQRKVLERAFEKSYETTPKPIKIIALSEFYWVPAHPDLYIYI